MELTNKGSVMVTPTAEVLPVQPFLEELAQAREHTNELFSRPESRDFSQRNRDDIARTSARRTETFTVRRIIEDINQADPSVLSDAHKAIAIKVAANGSRPSLDLSLAYVGAGIQAYERIAADFEQHRGTVIRVDKDSVALYDTKGQDDIRVSSGLVNHEHRDIQLRLSGNKVALPRQVEPNFPDIHVEEATFRDYLLSSMGAGSCDVAQGMAKFDPASDAFALPFTRLGTPEQPTGDINSLLTSDVARYGARLLVVSLGKEDWLHVQAPDESLQQLVVDRISAVYSDVLLGDPPRDRAAHFKSHSGRSGGTAHYLRETSLAALDPTQRTHMFYAADITADRVEEATRERIAKLAETRSAIGIAQTLRAAPIIDAFFAQLNTPEAG